MNERRPPFFAPGAFRKRVPATFHGEREVRLLKACSNHPNVVGLLAIDRSDPAWLVVEMEACERSLGAVFAGDRSFLSTDPARAARIFRGLFDGIDHLHRRGIMHRDIKPDNILVHDGCHARIADFGLAVEWEDFPYRIPGLSLTLPFHDEKVASPWFEPPECRRPPEVPRSGHFLACAHRIDDARTYYPWRHHRGRWCAVFLGDHLPADHLQAKARVEVTLQVNLDRVLDYGPPADVYMAGIVLLDHLLGFCPTAHAPLNQRIREAIRCYHGGDGDGDRRALFDFALRCTDPAPHERPRPREHPFMTIDQER